MKTPPSARTVQSAFRQFYLLTAAFLLLNSPFYSALLEGEEDVATALVVLLYGLILTALPWGVRRRAPLMVWPLYLGGTLLLDAALIAFALDYPVPARLILAGILIIPANLLLPRLLRKRLKSPLPERTSPEAESLPPPRLLPTLILNGLLAAGLILLPLAASAALKGEAERIAAELAAAPEEYETILSSFHGSRYSGPDGSGGTSTQGRGSIRTSVYYSLGNEGELARFTLEHRNPLFFFFTRREWRRDG